MTPARWSVAVTAVALIGAAWVIVVGVTVAAGVWRRITR